jgi:hypothetical protein
MSGPRLAAETLIWRNRGARNKLDKAAIAFLSLIAAAAILILERRSLPALHWLQANALWGGVLAAFFSAVGVAQRRALKRTQFSRSWLAALPVRTGTARREAFFIETLPAAAAIATLCVLAALASLLPAFDPSLKFSAIFLVWAYLCGGVLLGVALSFLIPVPKPMDLPPGSRYVPKPKIIRAALIRPSLLSLGGWPIRQMFAWAQPKVVARALIPVLVMMPLGTKADDAMIAIALFGVLFAMVLLSGAVISVSRAAVRWLAPAPVRESALIRAVLLPASGLIAAGGVMEVLLLMVFNVSFRTSAIVGAITALMGCMTLAVALLWRMRPGRRVP